MFVQVSKNILMANSNRLCLYFTSWSYQAKTVEIIRKILGHIFSWEQSKVIGNKNE